MVLHSLWVCPSNNPALILPTNNRIFRRVILNQTKCSSLSDDDKRYYSSSSSRRDFLLLGGGLTSLSLTTCSPISVALAGEEEQDHKMASFLDEVNAYSYLYPLELPSKKFVFKWVESRKPKRYSSAAPLSPNARLRIVSERVDLFDNLIISVTIGPPSANLINLKDKSKWTAKDVVDSVLADKSSLFSAQPRVQFSMHILMKLMANLTGIMNTSFVNRLIQCLKNQEFTGIMLLQQQKEMVICTPSALRPSVHSGKKWGLYLKRL